MSQPIDSHALRLAILSYLSWGFFPMYWRLLHRVPSVEILAHRIIWSCVFYGMLVIWTQGKAGILKLRSQSRRDWLISGCCATLLAINWGVYIYAVNSGRILQGSMAYFINPIFNIAVGVLFFKEPFPRPLQAAFGLAVLGVLTQAALSSVFPSIALILAVTFCFYGVLKKQFRTSADTTSLMEGLMGVFPALIAAAALAPQRAQPLSVGEIILLMGGGAVTGLPLYFFSRAAQSLPYSVMGILQFISPTLQFAVGYLVYEEKLDFGLIVAFALIWTGVAIYLSFQLRIAARGICR